MWELLTCEIPYKDFDSSAIIWGKHKEVDFFEQLNKLFNIYHFATGVGNQSLMLPIPATIPEGFKLLIKQCWSTKAKNRPSFRIILSHLEIACAELLATHSDSYYEKSVNWKKEVSEKLQTSINNSTKMKHSEKVSLFFRIINLNTIQQSKLIVINYVI